MILSKSLSALITFLVLFAVISGVVTIASDKSVTTTQTSRPTPLSLVISNSTHIHNASNFIKKSSHSSSSTYFYDPREVVKTEGYWS
ncbi:MAG: hypothetical protein DRO15_06145, partial [Thermoprotei archaeon]